MQVKLLNKLASARASGKGVGSKVLTDLVEGLEEPAIAVELRLKINQNHPDLKGRYGAIYCSDLFISAYFLLKLLTVANSQILPGIRRSSAATLGKLHCFKPQASESTCEL